MRPLMRSMGVAGTTVLGTCLLAACQANQPNVEQKGAALQGADASPPPAAGH